MFGLPRSADHGRKYARATGRLCLEVSKLRETTNLGKTRLDGRCIVLLQRDQDGIIYSKKRIYSQVGGCGTF